jgi:hypothetical protein
VASGQKRKTLRRGRNRNREIESEGDGFVETTSFFTVPKVPDLAVVSGIHSQPIDKHSEQGQEDDLKKTITSKHLAKSFLCPK